MSLTDFFTNSRKAEANAAVIFDEGEPNGRPTDQVLTYRRWFARFRARKNSAPRPSTLAPNER